jgi:hypothetical protein
MVQDYMGIQWPVTQFAYEFSTYFREHSSAPLLLGTAQFQEL